MMTKSKKVLLLVLMAINCICSGLWAYNDTEYARFFINKKCHQCDLFKANFSGADLTNADFRGSNLILANFQKATLINANFTNVTMTGANFSGAMWVDGSICQQGSYGRCIKKPQN
jgi:pentapeptide repeat protein